MDQQAYSLAQAIRTKRYELDIMRRDLAAKDKDLAQLEHELAAYKSRRDVKFVESLPPAPAADEKKPDKKKS